MPARDRAYLDWVKTQWCVSCGRPADDPHHVIGHGLSGMATKVSDYLSFPMCRVCHSELHQHGHNAWESLWGNQFEHVLNTLYQAIRERVIDTAPKELCLVIEGVISESK